MRAGGSRAKTLQYRGGQYVFETSAFIAARSSICSSSCFLSLAFSSPSVFSRFACDTPCLRHRSAHFAPASCSARMPMICSSVNLVHLMVRSQVGRTLIDSGPKIPWQVTGKIGWRMKEPGQCSGNTQCSKPLRDRPSSDKSVSRRQSYWHTRWFRSVKGQRPVGVTTFARTAPRSFPPSPSTWAHGQGSDPAKHVSAEPKG